MTITTAQYTISNVYDGTTLYTWVKYADDNKGTNMTDLPNDRSYIGIAYNQTTPVASTDPTKYAWALFQGPQGDPGVDGLQGPKGDQGIQGQPGANGLSTYTHIAYATNATGTSGFSVNDSTNKTYIGMYVDNSPTDSTDPTKYKWTLIKGADGSQGLPGPAGADGKTPYFHTAYATNATGTTGFSITDSVGKTYIGTYTDFIAADSTDPSKYKWVLIQGPQGSPGVQGPPGPTGQTLYTWLKYADTPTTGMSDSPTNKAYIGLAYNKTSATESTNYADYTWSLVKGADGTQGVPGPTGPQGQATYTWIKYGTSTSGAGLSDDPTGKTHIGIAYNKTTATESTNPADYLWSLIQGAKGDTGSPGAKGDPGANGADAVVAVLSNDSHVFPADSAGNVSTFANGVTTMSIFLGATDNSSAWTVTASPSSGVTGSLSGKTYTVSTFTADSGHVDLTASRSGYASITRRFSLSKAKQGATGSTGAQGTPGTAGANATAYWLVSNVPALSRSLTGVYTPTSLTFTGKSATGTAAPSDYAGRFIISETTDGTNYTERVRSTANETSRTFTPSAGIRAVRVQFYLAGAFTTLLDEQIIAVVSDGATGATGSPGATGPTGPTGPTGAAGQTYFTWLKYADSILGAGMSDSPVGKRFFGIATNKTTATKSTNAADYTWSPLYDNVVVGGANILNDTATVVSTSSYMMKSYVMTENMIAGQVYTISLKGELPAGQTQFGIYLNGGTTHLINLTRQEGTAIYTGTFTGKASATPNPNVINVYNMPSNTTVARIDWIQLEKGNIATDWTPSLPDTEKKIKEAYDFGYSAYGTVEGWKAPNKVTIDGSKIEAGSISANQIAANAITSKTITSSTINGSTVNSTTLNSSGINLVNAGYIKAIDSGRAATTFWVDNGLMKRMIVDPIGGFMGFFDGDVGEFKGFMGNSSQGFISVVTANSDAKDTLTSGVLANLEVGTIRQNDFDGGATARNPSNSLASVNLGWTVNTEYPSGVARVRVGGTGSGAVSGFNVMGTSDRVLLRVDNNGNLTVPGITTVSHPTVLTPDFINGWINYGAGYENCYYFMDQYGYVHLHGMLRPGTGAIMTSGTSMFRLNSNYRPNTARILSVGQSGNGSIRIDVLADGNVTFQQVPSSYISLTGIKFRING